MAQDISMIVDEILIEVMVGLIVIAIVGAAGSFYTLYRCVHRQAIRQQKIETAMAVIVRLFVSQTKRLHPESTEEMTEIEEIYKDLIDGSK